MFNKAKDFTKKAEKKIEKAFAPMVTAAAALGFTPIVCAEEYDPSDAMQKIINTVFTIFQYIGILLALWGAGSLIMAFKNEDADSKTRAIMALIVGVSLVSLRALFGNLINELLTANPSST